MSPAPSTDYGTADPRAFAYFVAGLFAERTAKLDVAAELYSTAMSLDPGYHKALNNRGLLIQGEGAQLYVKGTDDTRARTLLEDAIGLFARAKVLKSIAEYHHNHATCLSYLGRLDLRAGLSAQALRRQEESIVAYDEALRAVDREIAAAGAEAETGKRAARPEARRRRAEREGFKRSVQLALAISHVLARELDRDPGRKREHADQAEEALHDVYSDFAGDAPVASHPRLEYNLACYFAVTKDLKQATSLFLTLRAVTPNLSKTVLNDPDLADRPEILALFAPRPPTAPAPAPPIPEGADEDPSRDEPT